ncbi:hypothetical protein FGO68_gene3231 [Halteria grandinella]|uniref:Uncharacterized protein n=1 Tax=Halteria grandinella TaxID=5974 RepID=A0A8J8NCL5_HALGN|nr:hypothetical protein FGO68_gene3231 [Halteria grandinella]
MEDFFASIPKEYVDRKHSAFLKPQQPAPKNTLDAPFDAEPEKQKKKKKDPLGLQSKPAGYFSEQAKQKSFVPFLAYKPFDEKNKPELHAYGKKNKNKEVKLYNQKDTIMTLRGVYQPPKAQNIAKPRDVLVMDYAKIRRRLYEPLRAATDIV